MRKLDLQQLWSNRKYLLTQQCIKQLLTLLIMVDNDGAIIIP